MDIENDPTMKKLESDLQHTADAIDDSRRRGDWKASKQLEQRQDKTLKEMREITDSSIRASRASSQKSGGCFVATACYGRPDSSEVYVLRQFRDEHLLKTSLGKVCVSVYYLCSPPVAGLIRGNRFLRWLTKHLLIDPLVHIIEKSSNLHKISQRVK